MKIRKSSNESFAKSATKKVKTSSSFNGVESIKSPKSRKKSFTTIQPSPVKSKLPKKEKTRKRSVNQIEGARFHDATKNFDESVWEVSNLRDKTEKNFKATKKHGLTKKEKSENISVLQGNQQKQNIPLKVLNENVKKASKTIKFKKNYGITKKVIKSAVNGVIKLHTENPKLQKQLFTEHFPILMQICCHKVPRGHQKILRIPLKNSLLTPDDDICLIVPEVKGIKNIELDKHVEHYENLLESKGITNIKKIMTLHELTTEHETFEQKIRLAELYSVFLVDGRISGKTVKKCGKIFYRKHKVPVPVKLQATKLKDNFDKALSKAFFHLHLVGNSYSVQFGHSKMNTDELLENVYSVLDFLDREFPGAFANIKGLYVYSPGTASIPIHVSLTSPNEIVVPKVQAKKPRFYQTHRGELTTLPNAAVTVKPTGEVIVHKLEDEEETASDDKITDAEIIRMNKEKSEEEPDKKKKTKSTKAAGETVDLIKRKVKKRKISTEKQVGKNDDNPAEVMESIPKRKKKLTDQKNLHKSKKNSVVVSKVKILKDKKIKSKINKKKSS